MHKLSNCLTSLGILFSRYSGIGQVAQKTTGYLEQVSTRQTHFLWLNQANALKATESSDTISQVHEAKLLVRDQASKLSVEIWSNAAQMFDGLHLKRPATSK